MGEQYQEWAHAPSHLFKPDSMYFITTATYQRALLFDTPEKLDFLVHSFFDELRTWNWIPEAWAFFANHYHCVALAPENAKTLHFMLKSLHSKTAIWLNKKDGTPRRKVWFQYRDTCLTYERSYLARMNYTMNNPVKHGVARNAENYRWCSMSWFVREASPGWRRTVLSVPCDKVTVEDDH